MYRAVGAYVIVYGAIAAWAPYLAAYYNKGLGIPLALVGLLMAMTSAVSLICSPIWGALHDRDPKSRLLLPAAAAIAAAGAFGLMTAGATPLLPLAAGYSVTAGVAETPRADVQRSISSPRLM